MSLITKPPGADRGGVKPLITKPGVEVFQDSTAVKVVRGSHAVAVEGGQGLARGASKLWFGMILVVFILTGLGSLPNATNGWGLLIALPMIGGAIWLLVRLFRGPRRPSEQAIQAGTHDPLQGISVPLPAHLRPEPQPTEAFHVDYFSRALTEKAGLLGVLGLVLMSIFIGIWLLARALLVLLPLLAAQRACVVADQNGLTVHSLTGHKTLTWDRVDTVELRTFGFWSLWVSTITGSRRHVVVTGRRDFDRIELLIPYTLCGLDRDGAQRLAQRILDARDGARASTVTAAPRRPVSVPATAASAPAYHDTPEPTFDPDAIMARYLAEREQVIAQAAMPAPGVQAAPRGFGRKGLAG